MAFALKPHQTVLFIGDSITDCGRLAADSPLGTGYVRMIRDLIVARYPAHELKIINKGIGGNTVQNLTDRWSDDCIRFQPDWISVKIGINDVHRTLRKTPDAVPADMFDTLYDQILTRVSKETKARLVLVDPFYISTERCSDSFRHLVLENLKPYWKTVERLARKYKARHVRTHLAYQKLLQHYPADQFCHEPVHPQPGGHLVIAHEWLKVMGW